MPSVCVGSAKELLRLRREIFLTIRIQNPNFQPSEAFNKLISDRVASFLRAGVSEDELTRMTLVVAQKFIKNLAAADAEA
jgi:hypothetical protein